MRCWISTILLLSLVPAIGQEPAEKSMPQSAPTQAVDDGCVNIATVIEARPGDSFIALFGNSWQRVAACNRFTAVRNGRVVTSPDLLVTGSWIRIPAGTPMTPEAAARAGALAQQRLALLERLERLPIDRLDADDRAAAELLRNLLNDNVRFASDEQFTARELAYLEDLAAHPTQTMAIAWPMPMVAATSGMILLALVLAMAAVKRPRSAGALLRQRQAHAQAELARTCARAGIRLGP